MLGFRRNICFVCLILFLFSASWAQNATHEVKEGETLYRISKLYGVSVAMILENNAGMSAETLRVGDKLTIPTFTSNTPELREYKTKRGETFYGIARANGLTVEQLAKHNPGIEAPKYKIRRGTIIYIPIATQLIQAQDTKATVSTPTVQIKDDEKQEQATKEKPTPSKEQSKTRVALILPFKSSKGEGERCIEFYRGFLMSAKQFKSHNTQIEIHAFDEGTATDSINELLKKIDHLNVDLLIAPVYFSHLYSIGKFAQRERETQVVIPFTSKASIIDHSPNVFLLNTPEQTEVEEVKKLITAHQKNSRYVFLEYLNGNKKEFCLQLKKKLINEGHEVLSIEFPCGTQTVADTLSSEKHNVIIPNSSSTEALEEMIHLSNGLFEISPEMQCHLLGYSSWADYLKSHLLERVGKSIYYATNAFHDDQAAPIIRFKAEYQKWFKKEMLSTTPRMALLGYDCATHFLSAIIAKKQSNTHQNVQLLQSDFKFTPIRNESGKVNAGIWLMHYLPDGSLVKCSY